MDDHIAALIAEAIEKSDLIDDIDHPRPTTWHIATMQSSVLVRVELLEEQEVLSFAAELDVPEGINLPFEMLMNFNSFAEETGVFLALDAEGGPLSVRRLVTTRGISVGDMVAAVEATAQRVLSIAVILPEAATESEAAEDANPEELAANMTMLRG
ncbi:MAG: hypothetical protein AAGH74_02585 [Pseudomonadota bacterium]